MKLKNITLQRLDIAFHTSFKHAAAERKATEAVIATAYAENGVTGRGEGCPRQYVTGETIDSCFAFLKRYQSAITAIEDISSLKQFVADNRSSIDQNPAAWCAIETALLDLLGILEGKSIETILALPEIHGEFQYTAVLGLSNPRLFQAQLAQYLQLGCDDFKVKISGNAEVDTSNIAAIQAAVPNARIRLDANNLWQGADEAIPYLTNLAPHFWAVEEPIKAGDYIALASIASALGTRIILDESFLRLEELERLSPPLDRWIPNIRISKMGGLLRSLAIAEACAQRGVQSIIGAQVGETSILTRVAIALANRYRPIVIAQEGAYGTYLLEQDVADPPLMFKKGGIVALDMRDSQGLGLSWKS